MSPRVLKKNANGDSPEKKVEYDVNFVDGRDRISFDMGLDEGMRERYVSSVDCLGCQMTQGGTRLNSSGVTYVDPKNPVCKFRIAGSYRNEDVTTTFLVTRPNVYFQGFSYDDNHQVVRSNFKPTYNMCFDSDIVLPPSKFVTNKLPFSVGYEEMDPIPDDCKSFKRGKIGKHVILSALYYLKYGNTNQQQFAFATICVHFAEAARFSSIRDEVVKAMDDSVNNNTLGKRSNIYINNWQTISKASRFDLLDFDQFDIEDLSKFRRHGNVIVTRDDLDILYRDLSIFLVESKRERKDRRKTFHEGLKNTIGKSGEKIRENQRIRDNLTRLGKDRFKKFERKRSGWKNLDLISRTTLSKFGMDLQSGLVSNQMIDLIAIRKDCLKQAIDSGGSKDIWDSLRRALWRGEDEDSEWTSMAPEKELATLIIENTDINFCAEISDLSHCFDDRGFEYNLPHVLLCDRD